MHLTTPILISDVILRGLNSEDVFRYIPPKTSRHFYYFISFSNSNNISIGEPCISKTVRSIDSAVSYPFDYTWVINGEKFTADLAELGYSQVPSNLPLYVSLGPYNDITFSIPKGS